MTRILSIILILIAAIGTIHAQPTKGIASVKSPDGKTSIIIYKINDTTLAFSVSRSQKTYIDTAQTFISYGKTYQNAIKPIYLSNIRQTAKRDTLRTNFGERKVQIDHYNELAITFKDGQLVNTLKIRAYNHGFASGVEIINPQKLTVDDYHTTYHWTNRNIYHLFDTKSENGYNSLMGKDRASALAPTLTIATSDTLFALTNEAANYEFFTRAKITMDNFSTTIAQTGLYKIANYYTPWHYVVLADNINDYIEGKYLLYSLNFKPTSNYNWVKPGKAYRHVGNKDADFATDRVKISIDFAAKMKFQYVLLDNGWYGLGYDNEFDPASDPTKTVSTLDLPEVIKYAKQKGIGILVYVNKTALNEFPADSVLTIYSKLGIKGVKLGFFKNRTPMDNVQASRIITKCATLGLVVNVHDEYRSTGVERLYPNLLTCEGLRGNEHLDNTGNHTTLLPFIRYMTGAADYTICYDAAGGSRLDLQTTKAHQLALSIILFSPLQHIFWYGSPDWYSNEMETELFKRVPTVWDDFKVIDGYPRRHYALARRNGNTWYVAAIAGLLQTDIEFPLSKISQKTCSVTLYEDDTNNASIRKKTFTAIPSDILKISIRPNSGCVMVIEPVGK